MGDWEAKDDIERERDAKFQKHIQDAMEKMEDLVHRKFAEKEKEDFSGDIKIERVLPYDPYLPIVKRKGYSKMADDSGGSGKPKDSGAIWGGTLFGIDIEEYNKAMKYPSDLGVVFDEMDGCSHEPVDVGFQFSKWVCKKCNKDLPGKE